MLFGNFEDFFYGETVGLAHGIYNFKQVFETYVLNTALSMLFAQIKPCKLSKKKQCV